MRRSLDISLRRRGVGPLKFGANGTTVKADSPAMIADGNHARIDGFVSLGVVASALVVSLGLHLGDPIIGLAITLVILRITWKSWRTVSTTEPGEVIERHADESPGF